jgi:hypothetical protein
MNALKTSQNLSVTQISSADDREERTQVLFLFVLLFNIKNSFLDIR